MTRNLLMQIGLAITITFAGSMLEAQEQDALVADLYGRGVHAYFEGQFDTAHKLLSDAIEQKTIDPRCYYFRGVTYTRLGRPDDATKDFQEGARLEARDVQKTYPVNRSLQRVQGKVRITLEAHRQQARLELRKYEEKRRRVRYEALKAAEQDVLRNPQPQTPANVPQVPDDAKLDPNNPFSGDEAGALGGGTAQATKQKPAGQSTAGTTRQRPVLPAATATTNQPATTQPAAKPAGANPFGGAPAAKPAGANPFGGAPAAQPEPAQPEPAQPAANPFGAAPAAQPGNVGAPAPAQKKGGAFGALFRATVKSIPGADAARKAIQGNGNNENHDEVSVEAVNEEEIDDSPAPKPAANPFGPAPGAQPAPAGAKPAPSKPAPNPFGAP